MGAGPHRRNAHRAKDISTMSHTPPTDPDARLFDEYYAASRGADVRAVPWAHGAAHPFLHQWLERADTPPAGRNRALVIASGLGDDAEALAARGWQVTAFDASETAIAWTRERFPDSPVDYHVADLFALPPEWTAAFDLVVEIHTIQALPPTRRQRVIARIASTVAPGGTLFVVTFLRDARTPTTGRPWPLTKREVASIGRHGMIETARHIADDHPGRLNVVFERA
jgi:SAM-dependent methyltransferase